ncbi:helix-turn-helix domain-containing protein [Nocardia sp. alder85J]|uniref:helix-turn-helix domain-containing protein n=1 Tax=Nocardia sp. alder85J TaxID=2862949 RepID=UPI001CD69CB9|nr:helix-turn-helix transcriptional regulator [Nocardia sp. alder85J]MCX4093892.1 helix-turn-helix transcriptional regulator [Nocardia sp. alder85J]
MTPPQDDAGHGGKRAPEKSLELESRYRLARVMRHLRERAGLTRAQLAALLGNSDKSVEALERGDRGVKIEMLWKYFNTAEPVIVEPMLDHVIEVLTGRARLMDDLPPPTAREIAFCDRQPGPAMVIAQGSFDLGYCNEQGREWLQGVGEYRNLIVWMMLDRRAKDVFGPQGWEPFAYLLLLALEHLSIELVGEDRRRALIGAVSQAPEYKRLSTKRTPIDEVVPEIFTLRNPGTGETADFYFGSWRSFFPPRRPDWQQLVFWRV